MNCLLSLQSVSGKFEAVQVRLWDLAFSVDVSDEALFGGATLGDIWDRGTIAADNPM